MDKELQEILGLLKSVSAQLETVDSRMTNVESRLAAIEKKTSSDPSQTIPIKLISRALQLTEPEDKDVLLCLDFGTARSKAFATNGSDEIMVDIAVGQQAGSAIVHSVLSCVYIGDDGRIYFGETAAAKSELAVDRGARKRIDSFKAMITNASPGTDLRATPYGHDYNPTAIRLSEGDILSLYLAYFTDLAGQELTGRHGLSRYVRRRFTTPVFSEQHQQWASSVLRRHYTEAVLIADQFSGRWQDGIDVSEAKQVLQSAANQCAAVEYLMESSEVEPVAAFGSRFRYYEPRDVRRQLVSIVDIGAGTTDFATFAVLEQPERGVNMFLIPGSVHAVRKAGNEVDRILREYILNDLNKRHAGQDENIIARIKADLSLRQRSFKEQLFRDGRIEYTLADDTKGEVTLDSFLEDPAVKQFAAELQIEFEHSLRGIDPSWIREGAHGQITVIMTGGSANLPMVKSLGNRQVTSLSVALTCVPGTVLPRWVSRDYPELSDEFPQLAVAIGGSSRELPIFSEKQFSSFDGLSDQGKWVLPVASRGQ